MKILFLDIDGPMIPFRAYFMRLNQAVPVMQFDPVAVSMVNRLLHIAPAQLVISSSWGLGAIEAFEKNGIDISKLHADKLTPRGDAYRLRSQEIKAWLRGHPEVTHWVAFDDDPVPPPGGVRCSFEDGLQMRHFKRAGQLLGIDDRVLMTERLG